MNKLYMIASAALLCAGVASAQTPGPYELPAGVETEEWVLSYDGEARTVNMAIVDDQIYLGNLCDIFPDSYVIGHIDGDLATFPLTKIGYWEEEDLDVYFVPATWDYRYVEDFEEDVEDYFITEEYVFAYDAEAKQLKSTEEYGCIFIGFSDEVGALGPGYIEYYFEPFVYWANPAFANEPLAAPELYDAYYDEWYECDFIDLYIPSLNVAGYPLNTDEVYYVFYVDGEPFTFETDVYIGLEENMTEIPYDFYDENLFDIYSYGNYKQLCIYLEDYKTVGVKYYYHAPNGELMESEYVEEDIYTLSGGTIGSPSSSIVDVNANVISSVNYYDLTGRKVEKPQAGIYVKTINYADGQRVTKKVMVR